MKFSSLPDLSIQKPVLATVMSLLIVFAGLISLGKLPIREYPDIDPPVVTVTTIYPGANSSVIESEITEPIEEELAGIDGIRTMTSTSRDQVSSVVVEFVLEKNIDIAAQDLRDKISRIRSKLPENIDEPIIAKADADAQPIMWIRTVSDSRNMLDLSEYVDREIKDYFQNISGVSKVIFGGERRKSIQIMIDPKRMAFYGLSVLDVQNALKANNIELPAGTILLKTRELGVNVNAKISKVEDYENLIIKQKDLNLIRLKDIASIRLAAANDKSFVRFNGVQGFGLGIVRQAKANTIKISSEVHQLIDKLSKKLPKDIKLDIGYDSATFIKISLEELYNTIWQATLLVLIIIFVFLRNFRTTLIPALAIPISLIGLMFGIHIMGFTLNQMTLLGLIISIGIVVDDSIIVLENIYRYIEEGMEVKAAAKKGAEEISLAVMATTLVLVAIFLPVAFLTGITGRLLSEFAFSLCFATLISAFVSLSLAPMLCSKLLQQRSQDNFKRPKFYQKLIDIFENFVNQIEKLYAKLLDKFLAYHKSFLILLFLITLPLIFLLFQILPKDFIPDEDRGDFLVIFKAPTGSSLDVLDKQIRKTENLLITMPEIETLISVAAFGINAPGKITEGILIAKLKDWKERSKTVFNIVGPLYPKFAMMPEVFSIPITPKSGPDAGFGAQPIQIVLRSNDFNYLAKISKIIVQQSFALKSIMFARSNLSIDKPELDLKINRDKALSLGVSMSDISRSIELLFAGLDVTEFNSEGKKYDVIVKLPLSERNHLRKLAQFAVPNKTGDLILLSNLVSIQEYVGAEEINHYNRKKSVTISASPRQGITPSDGLIELENLIKKLIQASSDKPFDIEIDYLGASKESKDSSKALYMGFFIALIFAYLFLAAQFESFSNPLLIMLTVPLALFGALLGIFAFQFFPFLTKTLIAVLGEKFFWLQFVIPQFTNISINIYSQVGMIMLIGLSTKNGILLLEFMSQLLKRGLPLKRAVIEGAKLRLRPVLMTALATILGILPIALALGVGTQSRQSLGLVIVAGLFLSTLLTLFVIPGAFLLFNSSKELIHQTKNLNDALDKDQKF